jgi:hypothetical protein
MSRKHRPLWIVFPHRWKKGEKEKKELWMMVRTWTNWHLIRELLRTSNLKEGAVVAVGELSPRKKTNNGKEDEMKPSRNLGKEEEVVHLYATGDEQP